MIRWNKNPFGVTVILTQDHRQANRLVRGVALPREGYAGWCYMTGRTVVIYIDPDQCNNVGTLVHETHHAVINILKYIGADPADSYGELGAYMQDNMFTVFYKYILEVQVKANDNVLPMSKTKRTRTKN